MSNPDVVRSDVSCLFYDKSGDDRFVEFGYPTVNCPQEYRSVLASYDVMIVVVNLVDLESEDLDALVESKRLEKAGRDFIAIEGNVKEGVVGLLEHNLAFSRKLPKTFNRNLLKFSIKHSEERCRRGSVGSEATQVWRRSKLHVSENGKNIKSGNGGNSGKSGVGRKKLGLVVSTLSLSVMLFLLMESYTRCFFSGPEGCVPLVDSNGVVGPTESSVAYIYQGKLDSKEEGSSKNSSADLVNVPSKKPAESLVAVNISPIEREVNPFVVAVSKEEDRALMPEGDAVSGSEEIDNVTKKQAAAMPTPKKQLKHIGKERLSTIENSGEGYSKNKIKVRAENGESKGSSVGKEDVKKEVESLQTDEELETLKILAFNQINQRRYISLDGSGAMDYLRKVESDTSKGFRASSSIARAMMYNMLEDYISNVKLGDLEKMQELEFSVSTLHQYVKASGVDSFESKSFQRRIFRYQKKMEALTGEGEDGRELDDSLSEMRSLLFRMLEDRKKV